MCTMKDGIAAQGVFRKWDTMFRADESYLAIATLNPKPYTLNPEQACLVITIS